LYQFAGTHVLPGHPEPSVAFALSRLTWETVGAVPMGLLLPQPLKLAKHKDIEKTAKTREANRRMHPPRRGELLAVRRVY